MDPQTVMKQQILTNIQFSWRVMKVLNVFSSVWLYPAALSLVYGKKGYDAALFGYIYASNLNLGILPGFLNPILHTVKYF